MKLRFTRICTGVGMSVIDSGGNDSNDFNLKCKDNYISGRDHKRRVDGMVDRWMLELARIMACMYVND